ncbi:MAG TPA: hypothetical protein VJ697_03790 [Nitrososphaeraceae archaeon]|nr:hypothetical protein [Nitrososphaeraceae archaeon]
MGSIGNAVVYIINEGVVTRPVSNILNDNNKHNNEVNDVTIDFNRVSLTLQSLNDKIENLYKDY